MQSAEYMMLLGSGGYGTDAYLTLADAMQLQRPPGTKVSKIADT
jgi:hypothetical protein